MLQCLLTMHLLCIQIQTIYLGKALRDHCQEAGEVTKHSAVRNFICRGQAHLDLAFLEVQGSIFTSHLRHFASTYG